MTRAFGLIALLVVSGCSAANRPRDVQVVARGMTFLLASDPQKANPIIRLRPGERVRIVLRNEAPGLIHDFEIPSLEVKSDQIRVGETTSVTFTVPTSEGRYQYICGPHSTLMRGFVEVAAG